MSPKQKRGKKRIVLSLVYIISYIVLYINTSNLDIVNKNVDKNTFLCYTNTRCGEVAEWSKAQHWKCCSGVTRSWVRIPSSPPKQRNT